MDDAAAPESRQVLATKASLRESALRARQQLSAEERRTASDAAVRRLWGLPETRRARTVLLFAAMRDEIDPSGLMSRLRDRDVRVLMPRVRETRLELAAVQTFHALPVGYRGIREPTGPAIDPAVVDLAVVPGVAFDPEGGRLGHGGGHYDRLLAALDQQILTVGLCFSCQMVPSVPREPHDVRVHAVVTERAVYRPHRD